MLGASCCRKMLMTDASLTDWGAILEGRSCQGLWKDHHLSWHIDRLEMLIIFLALKNFLADLRGHHVLIHSDNTSVVSYINHQGGFAVISTCKTGVPNPPVVPREVVVSSSSLHPGGPQYRSRHPVKTGAEAWRMVWRLTWREFGQAQVDLFESREMSHCPLWFSLMHPAPLGLDAMVQT